MSKALAITKFESHRSLPSAEFFFCASAITLQDLELAALNRSSNLSKVVNHELDDWVEQRATAMVVRWLLENRAAMQTVSDPGPYLPFEE